MRSRMVQGVEWAVDKVSDAIATVETAKSLTNPGQYGQMIGLNPNLPLVCV